MDVENLTEMDNADSPPRNKIKKVSHDSNGFRHKSQRRDLTQSVDYTSSHERHIEVYINTHREQLNIDTLKKNSQWIKAKYMNPPFTDSDNCYVCRDNNNKIYKCSIHDILIPKQSDSIDVKSLVLFKEKDFFKMGVIFELPLPVNSYRCLLLLEDGTYIYKYKKDLIQVHDEMRKNLDNYFSIVKNSLKIHNQEVTENPYKLFDDILYTTNTGNSLGGIVVDVDGTILDIELQHYENITILIKVHCSDPNLKHNVPEKNKQCVVKRIETWHLIENCHFRIFPDLSTVQVNTEHFTEYYLVDNVGLTSKRKFFVGTKVIYFENNARLQEAIVVEMPLDIINNNQYLLCTIDNQYKYISPSVVQYQTIDQTRNLENFNFKLIELEDLIWKYRFPQTVLYIRENLNKRKLLKIFNNSISNQPEFLNAKKRNQIHSLIEIECTTHSGVKITNYCHISSKKLYYNYIKPSRSTWQFLKAFDFHRNMKTLPLEEAQPHECCQSCTRHVHSRLVATRDIIRNYNIYLIPEFFLFTRYIIYNEPPAVYYQAPCGVILANMCEVHQYLKITTLYLPIESFIFDCSADIYIYYDHGRIVNVDLSNGSENVNVPVKDCRKKIKNSLNNQMNFKYSKNRIFDVSIKDKFTAVCSGCNCINECLLETDCSCIKLTRNENRGTKLKTTGYQFNRLFEKHHAGIYECNINCSCNKKLCLNRVTQNALNNRLEIFWTKYTGWGVRAICDIASGTFLGIYNGVITKSLPNAKFDKYATQADFIEAAVQAINGNEASESANLELVNTIRSYYKDDAPRGYMISSENLGNYTRFFNHSCQPNIFVQNVFIDQHDFRTPVIAFFANGLIKAGEEITWNYEYDRNYDHSSQFTCHCSSDFKVCNG